jgi:hypothetical protein
MDLICQHLQHLPRHIRQARIAIVANNGNQLADIAQALRRHDSELYLVADLNRHAATHRNHVRDLLQKSVLRLISQILELKRGLAASASRISFEAAKFDGVRIGPVAADGRSGLVGSPARVSLAPLSSSRRS